MSSGNWGPLVELLLKRTIDRLVGSVLARARDEMSGKRGRMRRKLSETAQSERYFVSACRRRGTERKESEWKADPPLLHPFDRFIPECSAQLAKSGQRIQQTGRRRFLFRLFRSWNLANLSNGNRKENGSVPAVKRDGFVHLVSTDLHEIWHVDGHRCTARSCKVWMLHST